MLTINDLSASHSLDSAAMRGVRGGSTAVPGLPASYFDITTVTNAPIIDAGVHELVQGQGLAVNQSGSIGGFNVVNSDQYQFGVSGQVA